MTIYIVHNGQDGQVLVITGRAPGGPSKEAQKPPILQDPQEDEDPHLPPYNPLCPIISHSSASTSTPTLNLSYLIPLPPLPLLTSQLTPLTFCPLPSHICQGLLYGLPAHTEEQYYPLSFPCARFPLITDMSMFLFLQLIFITGRTRIPLSAETQAP